MPEEEWDLEADWQTLRPAECPKCVWMVLGSTERDLTLIQVNLAGSAKDRSWLYKSHEVVRGRPRHDFPLVELSYDTPNLFKRLVQAEDHFFELLDEIHAKLAREEGDILRTIEARKRDVEVVRKGMQWVQSQKKSPAAPTGMPAGRHTELSGESDDFNETLSHLFDV